MRAQIDKDVPDHALQAGDEFRLRVRLALVMKAAQRSFLAGKGEAVLRKMRFHLPLGEGAFAKDACKPAALVLKPFRLDGPGAVNIERSETHVVPRFVQASFCQRVFRAIGPSSTHPAGLRMSRPCPKEVRAYAPIAIGRRSGIYAS